MKLKGKEQNLPFSLFTKEGQVIRLRTIMNMTNASSPFVKGGAEEDFIRSLYETKR